MSALKQDHTLVRSGPYRIVRHPIYTGLLVALLGTAIAAGRAALLPRGPTGGDRVEDQVRLLKRL